MKMWSPGRLLLLVVMAAAPLIAAGPAAACTAFRLQRGEELIVGRNYDWNVDVGLVLVNKRGVTKFFDLAPETGGASWTSRFGSVTFNQYGRDLPQGGVNEQGLVVEILWLNGTEFPPPDDRPELGTTQWIQYQLDLSANVPDVIASLDRVRIRSQIEVHFFVTDRQGRSAAVEFLDGQAVCHTGEAMPAPTLTNHTYQAGVGYLRRHESWGGRQKLPRSRSSLDRFVRASTGARDYRPQRDGDPVAYTFGLLAEVAQGESTKWSLVYDLRRLRVHFRTQRERRVKTVDLASVDFDCESPVLMADINGKGGEDRTPRWTPYTRAANLELMTHSYRKTAFLENTPAETLKRLADYPERSWCGP